ncbi:type 4a pilus biogenesis protein PilO [Patescibacteria group bacterium]|nr:type 4a pilus biogenesis protein PilO [Patescibacteria group bacterium]
MNRILIITILFFISFLFFVYFLFPQSLIFENLKKKVLEKENSVQKEEIYFSNLEKISGNLKEYKESLEKIDAAVPTQLSIASLFSFFQNKALETGVFLKSVNAADAFSSLPGEIAAEKEIVSNKIKENFFSLSVSANFYAFENFLKEIERSSRMIEVEKITLKENEGELLEFDLVVKVNSLN